MTAKSFDSSMYFNMFVEIGSLSETEPAIFVRTYIRSLIRVDPEMIKEIMPFPEPFVAALMITL
jgi:hypothetical protein